MSIQSSNASLRGVIDRRRVIFYSFLSRRWWTQTELSSNEHFLRIFVFPNHERSLTCTREPFSYSSAGLRWMIDLLDKQSRRVVRQATPHRSVMNRSPVVPDANSLGRNDNRWWNARSSCGWHCTLLDRERFERDGQFLPQATVYSNESRFEQRNSVDLTCISYPDNYSRELSRRIPVVRVDSFGQRTPCRIQRRTRWWRDPRSQWVVRFHRLRPNDEWRIHRLKKWREGWNSNLDEKTDRYR